MKPRAAGWSGHPKLFETVLAPLTFDGTVLIPGPVDWPVNKKSQQAKMEELLSNKDSAVPAGKCIDAALKLADTLLFNKTAVYNGLKQFALTHGLFQSAAKKFTDFLTKEVTRTLRFFCAARPLFCALCTVQNCELRAHGQ